jgi:hypothetical protein
VEIRGNEDKGKILSKVGNEDESEKYFRWRRSIWIDIKITYSIYKNNFDQLTYRSIRWWRSLNMVEIKII